MNNQEKKRLSYTIRVRPYTGSSLNTVVCWLRSLDSHEQRARVEEALTMMYAVEAKISLNVDPVEIQRTYSLTKQALDKHCANLELQHPHLITSDQETPLNIRSKEQNLNVDNLFG